MKKTTRRRNKSRRRTRFPGVWSARNILLLLAGISGIQYLAQGQVSWPVDIYQTVTTAVREYTARPGAGWKKAADRLSELGATREGQPAPDFDLSGRVVRVSDGDTLSILDESGEQYTVRLFGIDTPEREQPHGAAASRALTALVANKRVGVVAVETDDYGRTVGTVYRGGSNVNLAMVRAGHAWWYRRYAPYERHLAVAERSAREDRRGLWSDAQPVPPWDWRRAQR